LAQSEEAFEAYNDKLFVNDITTAPKLRSIVSNEQYLEIISAPKIDHFDKTNKKKPMTRKMMADIELSDTEDEAEETKAHGDAAAAAMDIDGDEAEAPTETQ
jgi:DNA-directed RNA polymerase-3 subunit RPC5